MTNYRSLLALVGVGVGVCMRRRAAAAGGGIIISTSLSTVPTYVTYLPTYLSSFLSLKLIKQQPIVTMYFCQERSIC